MRASPSDEDRFERASGPVAGGGKTANRLDLHAEALASDDGTLARRLSSPGDFLSRLWSRFGPPDPGNDVFWYALRDRVTGLRFIAYCAGSGPAYACALGTTRNLEVLAAFDAWIAETPPSDCELEYEDDFGRARAGARGGAPFDEAAVSEGRSPPRREG